MSPADERRTGGSVRAHDLRAPKGARKARRRVGRGIGAGQGKTAGKGTKGQLARSGPGLPGWFEGGQTPLHMRVPKLRGFRNRLREEYVALNVGQLAPYAVEGRVTPDTLAAKGLVRPDQKIKLLADGEPGGRYEVHVHAASGAARRKIESAGGSIVEIDAS
ncbi:MAG: 50S ribosomal protein L15 [Candidatus Limnocylindria bacterium]